MAKSTAEGRYILSAGEIGSYTVCPEAWRLKTIAKVKRLHLDSVEKGHELHKQWVKTYDEAIYLSRSARMVIFLMVLTIALYILT